MINGTTTRSKIGYLVAQSPKNNKAFVYAQGDSSDIIGVVQSEVPPNQQAQISATGTVKDVELSHIQRCSKRSRHLYRSSRANGDRLSRGDGHYWLRRGMD